jgi:hypothetical protein
MEVHKGDLITDDVFVAVFSERGFEQLFRCPSEGHARDFMRSDEPAALMFSAVVRAYLLGSDDARMIAEEPQAEAAFSELKMMLSQQ